MTGAALALTNVAVAFGALRAVDGVTLSIRRGERRAVIGPNGAGKTTLFNAITGVIAASDGVITFEDHNITHQPPHRRARLGIARTFQITNLFPSLSVEQNMALAVWGLNRRKFSFFSACTLDNSETDRIAQALHTSRLAARRDVPVSELSYGEQRQLELAIALATLPRLLLLDEPAAGLSPAERSIVADVIQSLPRDLTLVLIEHDMDLALKLVDSVTCLHEGRILIEALPDAIRRNQVVQEVYLGKPRDA